MDSGTLEVMFVILCLFQPFFLPLQLINVYNLFAVC